MSSSHIETLRQRYFHYISGNFAKIRRPLCSGLFCSFPRKWSAWDWTCQRFPSGAMKVFSLSCSELRAKVPFQNKDVLARTSTCMVPLKKHFCTINLAFKQTGPALINPNPNPNPTFTKYDGHGSGLGINILITFPESNVIASRRRTLDKCSRTQVVCYHKLFGSL